MLNPRLGMPRAPWLGIEPFDAELIDMPPELYDCKFAATDRLPAKAFEGDAASAIWKAIA